MKIFLNPEEWLGLPAQTDDKIERGITAGMTGFPVREDLDPAVKVLAPTDTPLRFLLPRKPGSGLAHQWRQAVSLGGGYGYQGQTTAAGSSSTTVTVNTTAGLRVGDYVYFGTAGVIRQVSAVNSATQFAISAAATWSSGEQVYRLADYPHGGPAAQAFFAEGGSPAEFTPQFAAKTSAYKLIGVKGSITGLAMAAGANFTDQLAFAKVSALKNLLLNEENALLNGSSTDTKAPWGDGTTNYAYDGLLAQITTANGVPASNIQSNVGALTLAHINEQLANIWQAGGSEPYIVVSGQEARSLAKLAQQSGSGIYIATDPSAGRLGLRIGWAMHPVTGEQAQIVVSRFQSPGTILFGSKMGPDGQPAAEVVVLPLAGQTANPTEMMGGYWAQDIPASPTAPMVYGYLVAVAETLCVYSPQVFAVSRGVAPA